MLLELINNSRRPEEDALLCNDLSLTIVYLDKQNLPEFHLDESWPLYKLSAFLIWIWLFLIGA